jgi:exopolyphosphatase/guanosine-5'-triphosphate,3'-diphosphate pyrophosphatase
VTRLAVELYDSAKQVGLHDLGERERELFYYAALLHDIGAFVSYSNHPAHTFYLIANADLLGFDQTEIAIMATTGLFHRKGKPARKRPEYAELDQRSRLIVRILCALLRIAESLDRSHSGVIIQARLLPMGKNKVILEVKPKQDCQLELWGLESHLADIEESLERSIDIRVN